MFVFVLYRIASSIGTSFLQLLDGRQWPLPEIAAVFLECLAVCCVWVVLLVVVNPINRVVPFSVTVALFGRDGFFPHTCF